MNNDTSFRSDRPNPLLEQIHEGMKVYDRHDNEIGTVESVFFGSVSPEEADRGMGPASVSEADEMGEDTPVLFDFAFGGAVSSAGEMDEAYELVRSRLLREGYIEVDGAGLLAKDLYVLPDQVQTVSGERVQLSVTRDDLITKR
jgi:hypothetical protein